MCAPLQERLEVAGVALRVAATRPAVGAHDVGTLCPLAEHADDTWWASWYPIDGPLKNGAKLSTASGYAATFVTFNVDGDPRKARGYAKNVAGVEIDRHEVVRK